GAGRRHGGPHRGHELPADAAAAPGDALSAALAHSLRAAVSVLLDGAHRDQAGRAIARPRAFQSVLDLDADAQAHRQIAVRDSLSAVAREYDAGCHHRDHPLDRRQRARGLCDRAAALPGRAVGRRRDLPRLPHSAVDPVHSALDRRIPIRPFRPPVRAYSPLSHHLDPVPDLAVDGLFQAHPIRARGMRADRRRQPLPDPHQDRPAVGGAGIDFGLHLLLHAVLERIHLRAHLHFLDPEQDGAGRDRQRVRRRRHLPVGLADGGRASRLAAAGGPLRLLRRALRLGDDGRGQGIDEGEFCCHPAKKARVDAVGAEPKRRRGCIDGPRGRSAMDLTVVAYATLALSLFVSAVKMGGWILNADPRAIINSGRWALVALAALALGVLAWLIASGRWTSAMMLAAFMLPVFVQAAPRWRVLFGPLNAARSDFPPNPRDFGGAAGGFSSARATTDPELVRQAIAVLRAYLEQAGAQLEHKPAERRLASAAKGSGNGRLRMSREEALDVLGLEPSANVQEIADAHRRLGARVDP